MSNIVATVNGTPIDEKALDAAMQALAQEQFHAPLAELSEESRADLKDMAIERLIARELIYQAALAEGFIASQEDVASETSRIVRMAGKPKDFWRRLAERGMDRVAFERMVRKDVTVDLMAARYIADLPDPDEIAIERFFRENPQRLQKPLRVRVQHILFLSHQDNVEEVINHAEEVKEMTKSIEFGALAKKYSACPSAPGGGELGFIRRDEVDPVFADTVFNLSVGDVGGPIQTSFGVHLVKVIARENPGPPTLEESRSAIIEVLKRLEGARILEQWVSGLRDGADIVIRR